MTELTASDRALVESATGLLREHAHRSRTSAAAALRTRDGRVFQGLHLPANVARASLCAEGVALGAAAVAGSLDRLDTIATVHLVATDTGEFACALVSPCGVCRELLGSHALDLSVLVPGLDQRPTRVTMRALLPSMFRRPQSP